MCKSFMLFLISLLYIIGFFKLVGFPFVPSVDHKGLEMLAFVFYVLSVIYAVFYIVVSLFTFRVSSDIEEKN